MTSCITNDFLLGGKISLTQLKKGHRAGTDAVLLGAACPLVERGLIVDLGCGSGAVGLIAALSSPHAPLLFVDQNAQQLACARQNIVANNLQERTHVIEADIFSTARIRAQLGLGTQIADVVLTNPPFFEEGQGRKSPETLRQSAHHMEGGTLEHWIRTACTLLKPKGQFVMIHRADAVPSILSAIGKRLGGVAIAPVYPHARAPASRVLVYGVKGSKAPFRILNPLILHDQDGLFTEEARALHEGSASLSDIWG
jgi:tRNA1(Val) A37 N6-methylase TrmN6